MRRQAPGMLLAGTFLLVMIAVLLGPPSAEATHTKYTSPIQFPQVLTGAEITIQAVDADVQILAGPTTRMWTLGGVWPPPTIRRPTGIRSEVVFENRLEEIITDPVIAGRSELSIHHHGAHVPPREDGWACGFYFQPKSLPGGNWKNRYGYRMRESDAANPTGNERGVTQWYHNHRVDVTTQTIRKGLGGGFFIVDDPADPQTLPSGAYERTLMITNRSFDANNQIVAVNAGDHPIVNGVPQPFMNVDTHKYRFRVLNPGVATRFVLQLVQAADEANPAAVLIPVQQIATDSGLLPAPISRTSLPIGVAERFEIVIDFGQFPIGTNLVLRNGAALAAPLMQFRVTNAVADTSVVPPTLRAIPGTGTPVKTRTWNFTLGPRAGVFTINNLEMDCNRFDANLKLNAREEWVLRNAGGWVHSIHIHDVDQVCVSRNGGPCGPEEPFKETWPMLANETIVVQFIPTDFTQNTDLSEGAYMLHCHVLNHEDLAMMTQWLVTDQGD
jgi:spore coat protein A, manganese oxidase